MVIKSIAVEFATAAQVDLEIIKILGDVMVSGNSKNFALMIRLGSRLPAREGKTGPEYNQNRFQR